MNVAAILPCDVTKDEELAALTESLRALGRPLHTVLHSLAFANREDLARPVRGDAAQRIPAGAGRERVLAGGAGARHGAGDDRRRIASSTLTYLGATRVMPNYNVMGVAKASLEAAMRYLASDLGPQKIRVNAISAGPVKTASMRAVKDATSILDVVPLRAPLRHNTDPAKWPTPRCSWQRLGPRRHGKHFIRRRGHAGNGVLTRASR